jgi:mannosyltransferase OCH1-like enzyme
MLDDILNDNLETRKIEEEYNNIKSIKNGYKIPNIVHLTFCSTKLPIDIIKILQKNKDISSYCSFRFYDDLMCDELIKTHFKPNIYNAYSSINPVYGAMKADFFRYCVLYLIGGIYVDVKSSINYPLFKIIQKDDICLLDIPRNYLEPWRKNNPTYEQWLLIFAPKHPYLHNMINQMVNYIENKYEPKIPNMNILNTKQKILNVTGPDAFTKAVKNEIKIQKHILHRNIDYNQYFMWSSTTNNYKNMYKINNKKHYSEIKQPLYK